MAPAFVDCGAIYYVPDEIIQIPSERMPSSGERNLHEGRPFLVVQGQSFCADLDSPTVLGMPLSSKVEYKRETDFLLLKSLSGLKFDSVVIVGLLQPILKSDLQKKAGKIDKFSLEKIQRLLLINLGIIPV